MENSKRLKILIAVISGCLILALGFFVLSRKPSTERPLAADAQGLIKIGTVSAMIGEAEQRLPETLGFKPLEAGDTLYSGQMITVQNASEVSLSFDSGASVKLLSGARFVAVPDANASEGSLLGLLVEGEVSDFVPGTPPTLRVLKDGRAVSTGAGGAGAGAGGAGAVAGVASSQNANPVISVPPPSPNNRNNPKSKAPVVITATTAIETPTPSPRDTRGESIGGPAKATGETLGNEEIRKSIRGNSGFIQRCYLTYLNRAKPETTDRISTVTVGFIISNSGKVRDAKIVRSDFKDSVLNNCILETIERTSFHPFRGNDVPVLEFPIELQ